MARRPTRREFLRAAGAGIIAAPWIIPSSALGADGAVAPSERITLGVIGNGMMGRGHVGWCLGTRAVQLLAVCDVDRVRCEEGRQRADLTYAAQRADGSYRGCTAYNDYRELLARPDIDAVVIVTPDHWHTLQSIDAAKAGKDVYCEKPISITIQQGRALAETMRRYGRVFQTGTQYRSMPTTRRICEFVRTGGLGKVKSVFTLWTGEPVACCLPAEPVPDGLDWELWVGPAPWHDYNHRFHVNPPPGVVPWAFCEDFGVASVTGHHSHSADVTQYAIGMETSGPVEIIHPSSGEFPTLTYRYANGTLHHLVRRWGIVRDVYKAVPPTARLEGSFGGVLVGERGWVTTMYGGGPVQGAPETIFKEMGLTNREITGANNHHGNWLDCIRTRRQPSSHEEIGHRSASLGHLAIISFKLGRSLRWDPATEEFLGDESANRMRARAMRAPWRI
ncbi:MAG: Gfo/Idh/MocA family oxidoreductase [Planctomycetota bacterium]